MAEWIMAEEKTSLSPRETAMRMLLHVEDDVSYEDIIRQLRILQQIDRAVDDHSGTPWLEEVMPDVPPGSLSRGSAVPASRRPALHDLEGTAETEYWADDAFGMTFGAPRFTPPHHQAESADYAPYPAGLPSLVLRSRPLYSWRTLAERSEDRPDSFLDSASWIY